MNGTYSEVPAITRIEKLLIQLAVTVTVRKCCAVSSQWAPTACRWHMQFPFSDVYWVFSNICVSRVISHSWKRSLRRISVESGCGTHFSFQDRICFVLLKSRSRIIQLILLCWSACSVDCGFSFSVEYLCSCERGVVYSGPIVRDERFGEDLYISTKTE